MLLLLLHDVDGSSHVLFPHRIRDLTVHYVDLFDLFGGFQISFSVVLFFHPSPNPNPIPSPSLVCRFLKFGGGAGNCSR